ncbi:hypothetical protein [Psychroflexus sediminis]|uniref:Anti-sigma-K factor rskA n=1 Tax=Psychroflexus sediminis TaxID=470826 RepID=A0A1G7XGH3_9FLAO|nr:hypothetical protein [Psychroflexus sediminis]SDG83191.1 hypothetical protein SAMN04488027_10891 [Psychroflexus sediminis]
MTNKMISFLSVFAIFLITSCATTVDFPTSETVPGAEISAKIKVDDNSNYRIDLTAVNLTSPDRLNPPREMYVVWIETSRGTKNLGQLKMSSGLFSNVRKGTLNTTTPFKPQRIIITAESTSANNEPSSYVVTSSKNFEMD